MYPLTKRAAKPRDRVASIIRTAKSRQLPRRLWRVSSGRLYALFTAPHVAELFLDAEGHRAQQVHGSGGPRRIQKLACPLTNVIAGIVRGQRPREVGEILIRIAERIGIRVLLQRVLRQGGFEMLKRHDALKAKLRSESVEFSDGDGIVEHIMEPAKTSRIGRDGQAGPEKLKVVTFPRPEHHSMLPESDWLGITINRDMAYGKERHIKP